MKIRILCNFSCIIRKHLTKYEIRKTITHVKLVNSKVMTIKKHRFVFLLTKNTFSTKEYHEYNENAVHGTT